MNGIFEESLIELQIARFLRPSLVAEIERLGYDEVAARLDLAVPGVETLLWYSAWSIERTLRVMELLGLPIKSTLLVAFDQLPDE